MFQHLFFLFALLGSPLCAAAVAPQATVYFSPDEQLAKRLIELIDKEETSIHACVYTFTHKGIAKALIEAKKRGVDVELIVDRFSVKSRAPLKKLADAGIPVNVWEPDPLRKSAHRPLMHNKFCVFGSNKIWTGSFNWTYEAANLHQENALVLEGSALAAAYKRQFQTIKMRSCISLGFYVAAHPKRVSQPFLRKKK
jgi:phosphatidylserine/phosphatidylglycerophosphate/cardiolipin synthase-like enzyme